jgi:DNA-binding MarR family transcriptional regulator
MKATKDHPAETGWILHELLKEVFALQAALSSVMDKAHELSGLTTPQRKIMNTISLQETATVPDIAGQLGVSRQFVQTVCNKLISCGYIEFQENPRHKRSRLASLTHSGYAGLKSAQEKENDLIEQVIPDIGYEKAKDTRDLLEAIRKSLASFSHVQNEFNK